MTSGRLEYESGYVRRCAHPPESARDGNIETGCAGHKSDKFCRKRRLKNKQKRQWLAFCFIIARNYELCINSCSTKEQDDIT